MHLRDDVTGLHIVGRVVVAVPLRGNVALFIQHVHKKRQRFHAAIFRAPVRGEADVLARLHDRLAHLIADQFQSIIKGDRQ